MIPLALEPILTLVPVVEAEPSVGKVGLHSEALAGVAGGGDEEGVCLQMRDFLLSVLLLLTTILDRLLDALLRAHTLVNSQSTGAF